MLTKLWPEDVLSRYIILAGPFLHPTHLQHLNQHLLMFLFLDFKCLLWLWLSSKHLLCLCSVRYCHQRSKCVSFPSQTLLPIPSPWSGILLQRKVWGKGTTRQGLRFPPVFDLRINECNKLWRLFQWLRGVSQESRSPIFQSADLLPERAFFFGGLLQLP